VGAEHHVDPGRPLDDRLAVLLGQAAADRDLQAVLGLLAQVAEVAVEAVVGVLAHRAGVEDDDVRLTVRPDVPCGLQQPGQALGVVDVHLAAVRADLVGARRLGGGSGVHGVHGVPRVPVRAIPPD